MNIIDILAQQTTKQNLTNYSDDELSLIVFNDASFYFNRHRHWFIESLDEFFVYTDEQLEVLKQDIAEDLEEIETHNE
jgi:hypothetical protein